MARTIKLESLSDLPTLYTVSFPVGPDMPNVRDDVYLVQVLMKMANFARFSPGHGPVESSKSIKVDGWFGDQTKRMIKAFEQSVRDSGLLLVQDGIIEPSSKDGSTSKGVLYKMIFLNRRARDDGTVNAFKYKALPFDPETPPILRQALTPGAIRPPNLEF